MEAPHCRLLAHFKGIARRMPKRALKPAGARKFQPNGASDQMGELAPDPDARK